jgi:four helix bundle protein
MKDFRSLKVMDKAHALTLAVYQVTTRFPREELFGLTGQVRKSAASVGYNLAEGCGRGTDADFARFVQIAMGSACEVEYQLLLARDLGYLPTEKHGPLEAATTEVKRMLAALLAKLKENSRT